MADDVNSSPAGLLGRFRFGQFEVDLSTGELRKSGLRIRIQDQSLRILGALLESPGELVSREELRQRLWPSDTFVDFERSLNAAVAKLRQTLSDSAEKPRFVETIARRGYCFIAPVSTGLGPTIDPSRASVAPRKPWSLGLALGALAILIAVASAITIARHYWQPELDAPVVRTSIALPEKSIFTSPVAISPDGRRLAFGASTNSIREQIWVRSLDRATAEPLAGTEGGSQPFWSPDSRFLGFFVDGKLKKIDASGGPSFTLCEAPNGQGGTWSPNGTIVFSPADKESPLHQVSDAGGASSPVTTLDRNRGETTHRWPWFLPDGRHFLYLAGNTASGGTIRAASIDSKGSDSRVVLSSMFNAVYAGGYLLFLREGSLMAQPFDTGGLTLTGNAVPVARQIQTPPGLLRGVYSVSTAGFMVYRASGPIAGDQLVWFDRDGKRTARVGDPGLFGTIHLSPDGKTAAVSMLDPATRNKDVWLYDVTRGFRARFTHDPAEKRELVWSSDGRTIVFMSNRMGHFDLFAKSSSGAGSEELLITSGLDKYPGSFSPDGKLLLYWTQGDRKTGSDIWILPMTGERKPFLFAQTSSNEDFGKFAPNGRWIAYSSDETGQYEIYISPFPGPGARRRLSTGGGVQPQWRRDGREIFYIASDKRLMAAEVSVNGENPDVGAIRTLFGPLACGGGCYDVSADGKHFLVRSEPEQAKSDSLTLVQNWTAALKSEALATQRHAVF